MGAAGKPRDIEVSPIENVDWSVTGATEALVKTVEYASDYAGEAADWYRRFKKGKRRGARYIRILAITFVAAAGVLPMIQQLTVGTDGIVGISPVWASILLAIAVFLAALDRFAGFSTGWIRYVVAEAQIRRLRQEFELDWQMLLASYGGQPPTDEQVQHALSTVKAFVAQINTIIGDETTKWVGEFQEALKQVDKQVKATPSAVQTGSLAVTVTNGDLIEDPGWTLAVDQGQAILHTGKTAATVGLMPGDHVLQFAGNAADTLLSAETVATIKPGATTVVEVTLA